MLDLRPRFEETLAALKLGSPKEVEGAWEALATRYAEPQRHYHTLAHVSHCLDLLAEMEHDTPLLRLALFYHDVIYDPTGEDNELKSARFATDQLAGLGAPDTVTAPIYDLIRATDHRPGALVDHADLICDIDLAILGAPEDVYATYAAAIRREYDWIPDGKYRAGRIKILEAFHGRSAIYQTGAFKARFEAQARANIAAEVSALVSGRPFS